MDGIVYVLDENDEIISEMQMDFDTAIRKYYGQHSDKGRYFIGVKGRPVQFKKKSAPTFDIKRQSKQ